VKFVECVRLWGREYRTADDLIEISKILALAGIELRGISRPSRQEAKPLSANEARDRFIFEQY
jgi:hypothetical protein